MPFPADGTGLPPARQGLWRTPWPAAAARDSRHTRTAGYPKFFRRCSGWRQVALMGRRSTITHFGRGFWGRCPPCLLNHTSQPARRTRAADRIPPRARPTSAPTSGSSRSFISGTWLTLVRWTGPGGASSPTTSPPSRTGPGRSRSSRRAPPRPRPPPRRRLPPSPLPRARRCPRPPPRLPRLRLRLLPQAQQYLLPQAQQYLLPQAQQYLLPQAHPGTPRSAGCAAPRPAPSPT